MSFSRIPSCSPDVIVELVHALERSEFIVEACELGVFQAIHDKGGSCTVADIISEVVEIENRSTEMKVIALLDTCVSFGVLEKIGVKDSYANTDVSRTYLTRGEFSMLNLVKAARHKFEVARLIKYGDYEESRSWFYEPGAQEVALRDIPHRFRKFYLKQEGYAISALHLFKAFDLSKYKVAMDLGGGTGTHARALKFYYPDMHVTSLDLPRVTEFAHAMNKERNITDVQFHYRSVDLFNEDLPPADLYCVAHLVHMFSEDKSDVILRNVYRALRPGGAILLLEKTLAERRTEPELCTMYSCRLSLGREGGFERTVEQYKTTLQRCGFGNFRYHENKGYNCYDVMLATKL